MSGRDFFSQREREGEERESNEMNVYKWKRLFKVELNDLGVIT